jgi:hypothetical protein
VLCNAATDLTNQLGEKILQSVRGKRPEPIALQKEAKVDSVVLKSYEGTYVMQFIWAITVSLENGKLVAHLTNEDKFRLFAKSNTEFFCKVVPAWVSFEKGANGKVERLILHQNGIDTPCFKMRKPATAKP